MARTVLATLAVAALTISVAQAQDTCASPFRELTELPEPLGQVSAGAIGGNVYVTGSQSPKTFVYSVAGDSWSEVAQRPYPGQRHAAEVVKGKLYLLGGFTKASGNKVQIYDPAADAWTEGQRVPIVTGAASSGVRGTDILLCGGIVGERAGEGCYIYNTRDDSWKTAPDPLFTADHAASCSRGSVTYMLGGRDGPHTAGPAYDDAQAYDWASGTFELVKSLSVPRASFGCAVGPSRGVYVFGSEYSDDDAVAYARASIDPVTQVNSAVERFDGSGWAVVATLPAGLHAINPVVVKGIAFIFGGGLTSGTAASTTALSVDLALLETCPALDAPEPAAAADFEADAAAEAAAAEEAAAAAAGAKAAAQVDPVPGGEPVPEEEAVQKAEAPADEAPALAANEVPAIPLAAGEAENTNLEGWCVVPGADYDSSSGPGYDLDVWARAASMGECVTVCEQTVGCNAASLDVENNKCWLKSVPYEGTRVPDIGNRSIPDFAGRRVLLVFGECPCNLPSGLLSEVAFSCSTATCDEASGYCVSETGAAAVEETLVARSPDDTAAGAPVESCTPACDPSFTCIAGLCEAPADMVAPAPEAVVTEDAAVPVDNAAVEPEAAVAAQQDASVTAGASGSLTGLAATLLVTVGPALLFAGMF